MLKCKNIDNGKAFDWGLTSSAYARYRDIYPKELYERLRQLGVAADGSSWLDIGTGTGRYSLALADMGYDVTAIELVPHNIDIMRKKVKPKSSRNMVFEFDFSRIKKFIRR